MKFNTLFLFLATFGIWSCKDSEEIFIYNCDDEVCIELPRDSNIIIKSYSDDNIIYRNGTKHLFSYYYEDSLGARYLIGLEGGRLDTIGHVNSQTITKVGFEVNYETELNMTFPGENRFTQSGLLYNYLGKDNEPFYPIESSGLVENKRNIWIHPFRRYKYFAMLNINAYPFVKFPLEVGNTWNWQLTVGGHRYTNPIWAVWEGGTLREHSYKVVDKIVYEATGIGKREVWEIEAKTTGPIGNTSATFYYDDELGFLMMKWINLNKSIFRFDIEEILTSESNPAS